MVSRGCFLAAIRAACAALARFSWPNIFDDLLVNSANPAAEPTIIAPNVYCNNVGSYDDDDGVLFDAADACSARLPSSDGLLAGIFDNKKNFLFTVLTDFVETIAFLGNCK